LTFSISRAYPEVFKGKQDLEVGAAVVAGIGAVRGPTKRPRMSGSHPLGEDVVAGMGL